MKILVIYCTHAITPSFKYFIEHGYYDSDNTDFYICVNDPTLDISSVVTPKTNLFIHNRENIALDFGGWSEILFKNNLYENYDYFIFVNNTCTGPFLPVYVRQRWTDLLIQLVDDEYKLVGATINYWYGKPHVQSYLLCTDKIGLRIAIDNKVFSRDINEIYKNKDLTKWPEKWELINKHEIEFSKVLLDAGYNIRSLMKGLDKYDFRKYRNAGMFITFNGPTNHDMTHPNAYFGISIQLYEVMFFKSNRGITDDILNSHIKFHNSTKLLEKK